MTTTDHTATDCDQRAWCVSPHERMCDCVYSNTQPHKREGCRYARDNDEEDQGVQPA